MLAFAVAAARRRASPDPVIETHRRQLAEIDVLAARGALGAGEAEGARNEAARRLLTAAGRPSDAARPDTRMTRTLAFAAAASVPLLGLFLYLAVGSPDTPDQPFPQRVEGWRSANPATLGPQQVAAVLETAVRERPGDWRAAYYLGQAELASGDPYAALRSFGRATMLAPREAGPWEGMGGAFVGLNGGAVNGDAERAFAAALRLNPRSVPARFQLARARQAAGDRAGAAGLLRAVAADLPPNDPRRQAVQRQLAEVEGAAAPAPGTADAAIGRMVASLAERLEREPDDPSGWARLVRSYGVLGNGDRQAAALARARTLFRDRPADLALVEREAR